MRSGRPRYALVTGGGSGIGRAICLELARQGWTVGVTDINEQGGRETVSLIKQAGAEAHFSRLDVSSESHWLELRDELQQRWPHLNLVVNNAGVCAGGDLDATSVATWDWLHEINLRGAMLGCHTMIPWLKKSPGEAYIMNIASIAGLVFAPRMSLYNSTKAALVALSETLHIELKSSRIGVTAVCPWFSPTNLAKGGQFNGQADADYANAQMQASGVTPEIIAKTGLRATLRHQPICVVGLRARFLARLGRYFPGLLRWLIYNWASNVPSSTPVATQEAAVTK